jgi:hypothetical protein
MTNRRSFILSGLGLMTAGGLYRAWDRGMIGSGTAAAYRPWETRPTPGMIGLIERAILAPSPHNTQPWLFRIGDDRITILADRARHLAAMDPYRREMMVGLGAALETLVIAASGQGYDAHVSLADGTLILDAPLTSLPVADVVFKTGASPDPLSAHIPNRHTHRGAYDLGKSVPDEVQNEWRAIAQEFGCTLTLLPHTDPKRAALDQLVVDATQAIIADKDMTAGGHAWMRAPGVEVLAHRDGLTLDAQALSPFMLFAAKMAPDLPANVEGDYWLAATRDVHLATAPLFGLLTVPDPLDLATSMNAGRAWARIHLSAVKAGLAAQPINQIPERIDRERQLNQAPKMHQALTSIIGGDGTATFGFRTGYASGPSGRSPRRPAGEVILANG